MVFCNSRLSDEENYYQSRGGALPVRWTSVEALETRKFSQLSDVWSFGILMYEVWTKAALPYTVQHAVRMNVDVDVCCQYQPVVV